MNERELILVNIDDIQDSKRIAEEIAAEAQEAEEIEELIASGQTELAKGKFEGGSVLAEIISRGTE